MRSRDPHDATFERVINSDDATHQSDASSEHADADADADAHDADSAHNADTNAVLVVQIGDAPPHTDDDAGALDEAAEAPSAGGPSPSRRPRRRAASLDVHRCMLHASEVAWCGLLLAALLHLIVAASVLAEADTNRELYERTMCTVLHVNTSSDARGWHHVEWNVRYRVLRNSTAFDKRAHTDDAKGGAGVGVSATPTTAAADQTHLRSLGDALSKHRVSSNADAKTFQRHRNYRHSFSSSARSIPSHSLVSESMTSTIEQRSRSSGKVHEQASERERGRAYRCFALRATPTFVRWHVFTYMDAARLFVRALWYLLFAMLVRLAKLFLEDTVYFYAAAGGGSGEIESVGMGLIEILHRLPTSRRRVSRVSLEPYIQEYQPLATSSPHAEEKDSQDIPHDEAGVATEEEGGTREHDSLQEDREKSTSDVDTTCVICLESFLAGESVCKLLCGHQFHHECLARWVCRRGTCPVCIQTISDSARDYRQRPRAHQEGDADGDGAAAHRPEYEPIHSDRHELSESPSEREHDDSSRIGIFNDDSDNTGDAADSDLRAVGVVPRPMPPALVPLLARQRELLGRRHGHSISAGEIGRSLLRRQIAELVEEVLARESHDQQQRE